MELHQVNRLLEETVLAKNKGAATEDAVKVNVCMCFEQSKQFGNEGHTLCFLEFVELLCRVANDYYTGKAAWSLSFKVYTLLKEKLMPPFCRGEDVKNVAVAAGQDDLPIFEWPAGAEEGKKPEIIKKKKAPPSIPQYRGSMWHSMAQRLPVGDSEQDVKQRKTLWRHSDANGNGYLSLSEIHGGLRHILKEKELSEAKPAIASAFAFAKNHAKCKLGHKPAVAGDFVERSEYRVFLIALKARLEYCHAFKSIDAGAGGGGADGHADGKITKQEFLGARAMIEQWVGKLEDPAAEFEHIDADGGGAVSFSEFCNWAVRRNLDLEPADEAEGQDST